MTRKPAILLFVLLMTPAASAWAQDEAPPEEPAPEIEGEAEAEEEGEAEAETGEPAPEGEGGPEDEPEETPDPEGEEEGGGEEEPPAAVPAVVVEPAQEGPQGLANAQEAKPVEGEQKEEESSGEVSTRDRWMPNGKFMDTRITFVFSDGNTLSGMEEQSPRPGFESMDEEQFNEGLDSEKRGRETETHLVLYKRMPSYFRRMDAEAALVLELQSETDNTQIGDDGSYLKLNWYTRRDNYTGDNISLTMFPVDSQRFLLGYTYDITWGGEKIFPNNQNFVPGAKLQYDFGVGGDHQGYAFLGMKATKMLDREVDEEEMYYGALGGFGIGITRWLGWDVNGGYFQRGVFPPQGLDDEVGGKIMDAFGASTRLVFHQGIPIANSVDFRLYKVTPDAANLITEPQKYGDGFSWSLGGEYTHVWQNLIKYYSSESTELVPSKAAAANLKLMYKKARLHAFYVYRDLSYVVFDIPGAFPYHGFPKESEVSPEWFVSAGIDYYFETSHLTPGLIFGYKRPASESVKDVDGVVHTKVYKDDEDLEMLPAGEAAFDILTLKATLKWDVAAFFSVIGELRYTLDKNESKAGEGSERVFRDQTVTNQLSFAILAQAKW